MREEPTPPRPGRAVTALAAGLGAAVGAASWVLGLDPAHAAAGGCTTAAVVLALGALGRTPDPEWPDLPETGSARGWHGVALTSRLLEQLDTEPDRLPRLLLPRLRAALAPVLAERGVAPGSAAARDLLGPDLHDLLGARTWPDGAPSATQLVHRVVDRLDALEGGVR